MDALETIHVSSRGQIVIPESMRKTMGIKEGTKLVVIQRAQRLVIEKEVVFLAQLSQRQERKGWETLSSKSMAKVWDNASDDEIWNKY